MKAFWRRLAIIGAIGLGVFALLLLGRAWAGSQELMELDRAHLYARAVDQVSAATATPETVAAFQLILPFDIPKEDRPAGAPPAAFIGTGPAILPCPLAVADLRRSGPGGCSAARVALKAPPVCEFVACVIVEAPASFLNDRATRASLKAGDLRRRVCAMHGPNDPMGWRRESDGLPECGPLAFTPAVILLAERVGERDYRYRLVL
ncbi:MAG: hypothetical protein ACK4UQ_11635 [Brevundimonas sp.]